LKGYHLHAQHPAGINALMSATKIIPVIFEDREIRRSYDEQTGTW
jgi:hypothetical protein